MSKEIIDQELQEEQQPTRSRSPRTKKEVVDGEVVGKTLKVMTPLEYQEESKRNGRYMGRPLDEKTVLTPEEFVVLCRSDWTPKMIMDKHGLTVAELQEVADRVPLIMQLKRRITVTDKQIKW